MAKKKAARKTKTVACKKAAPAGERQAKAGCRRGPARRGKGTPAATWRGMARLAGDALAALDQQDFKGVRGCLEAIRAVALCADET